MEKTLNFSEISRHITGGHRNTINPNKIAEKHIPAMDRFFYEELPGWWEKKKVEIRGDIIPVLQCPRCKAEEKVGIIEMMGKSKGIQKITFGFHCSCGALVTLRELTFGDMDESSLYKAVGEYIKSQPESVEISF